MRNLFLMVIVLIVLMPFSVVFAHRSGCHRWHSCPSDTGSYVCGDLGYTSGCPKTVSNIKLPARATASVIKKVAPVQIKKPSIKLGCNPNYSGCLKADASDYDCKGGSGNGPYYTGKVKVIGYDQYDLDRDKDGWGCE